MLLFNFQGPLFLRSRFERSCSISHLSRKVNTFFQIFSEFFNIFLNISRNTIYRYEIHRKTQEEGLAPFFLKKNLFKISKIRGKTADFVKKILKKFFIFQNFQVQKRSVREENHCDNYRYQRKRSAYTCHFPDSFAQK